MLNSNQTKDQCCGCTACSNICPTGAITMERDEQGFAYPAVDNEKCTKCGLCHKVCPMEENYVGQDAVPDIYALRSKSQKILNTSSSGGMFALLSDWTLSQGGVVYGVAYDDAFMVRHMRAETPKEARRFRASKYVESSLYEVFANILTDLKEDRVVLLSGTPCQISAMQKFLAAKHAPTEKLYTCDNICHGVPSAKVWEDYLAIINKKFIAPDNRITFINMRSKKLGWREKGIEIQTEHGFLDELDQDFSFNRIYSTLYATRPSCFHCRYTSYKRPSDFTLGDFWNAKKAGVPFDTLDGVSEVLVNTQKGRELFKLLSEKADIMPLSKKTAWQPHLEYAVKAPKNQAAFWAEYNSTADKEAVLHKYSKGSLLHRIIHTATPFLQDIGLYNFAGKVYRFFLVRKGK